MRKPERVKNLERPRKAPFAHCSSPWYASTTAIATARRPSNEGW